MKQYAVLGLGRFGTSLASELAKMGHEVLAVDANEEPLHELQDIVTHVVQADVTDEHALMGLALDNFDCVIIGIGGNMEGSVLATLICKELGVKHVVAKASTKHHARVLEKLGVDRVILPEKEMGVRAAHYVTNNNIIEYISLSNDFDLVEIAIKPEWYNKSIAEINFRTMYGISIIGIRHNDEFIVIPRGEYVLCEGDILSIVGKTKDIEKL